MAAKLSGLPIRAAGGVVWRQPPDHPENSAVEIAVIHRPRYDDWTIPKGKLAPGESELDGALREVFEETGYRVRPGRALGEVRYLKRAEGIPREKVVHYWAMQALGGAFTPSREVDEMRWLSPDAADKLLTRSTDREILVRFRERPANTGTVLLVRHASAGSRSSWRGDDRVRPLDERGLLQAEELVRLLSRFEVQRLLSADDLRCVQTVQPLAESVGLGVDEEPLLSERGFNGRADEAVKFVRRLGSEGDSIVACSQRDVIPELVKRVASEDGVELPRPLPLKKGSVWALSFDGQALCGAEYFPPPKVSQ
jgi:8-oxo-dGTP diphosphatase